MIYRNLFFAVLVFAFVFLSGLSSQTFACTCIQPGPPCQSYWGSATIFSGEPISASRTEVEEDGHKRPVMVFRFKIEEVFRGETKDQIEIVTGFGGGDCGYPFKVGTKYLVYGHDYQKQIYAGICSRTRPLSGAQEDIAFFRGIATAPAGGSIFGSAQQYRINDETGTWEIVAPITKASVVVLSTDQRFETTTGDDGKYRISGLPPGKYTVHTTIPEKLSPAKDESVEIHDRGCAEINYNSVIDGRIIGKLLDSQGKSAGIKTIDLKPLDSVGRNTRALWAISDSDGSFEFKNIPPGRYIIGINLGDVPSKDLPYKQTFYPAGSNESTAKVFTLEGGQHIANVEFRLPPPLIERQVTGIVVWPDGRPALGAEVSLNDLKTDRMVGWFVKADASGHFTLTGYEGLRYNVKATIPADPNWKPESGEAVILLSAKSVEVEPVEKTESVRLVIETGQNGPKTTKQVLRTRRPR